MKVYLTGYMGSGKSSRGKQLANHLHLHWVDLDEEVERKSGITIAELFSSRGESDFRRLEKEVLREYGTGDQSFVMSTGGGTPVYEGNMAFMNATGTTVYLKVAADVLVGRLRKDRANRPLLSALPEDEVGTFVRSHFNLREPRYEESHLIWLADEKVDSISERIYHLERSKPVS